MKILQEMGIPDHLTCFRKNLYAGQETTVRTGRGTTKLGKEYVKAVYCHPAYLTYMQSSVAHSCSTQQPHGLQHARLPCPSPIPGVCKSICRVHHAKCSLDEAEAGIKTARRNINNLRYADDTTLMAESKEELKSLLMKVKEESEKAGLKLNI